MTHDENAADFVSIISFILISVDIYFIIIHSTIIFFSLLKVIHIIDVIITLTVRVMVWKYFISII